MHGLLILSGRRWRRSTIRRRWPREYASHRFPAAAVAAAGRLCNLVPAQRSDRADAGRSPTILPVRKDLHLGQTVRFMGWRDGQIPTGRVIAKKDTPLNLQEAGSRSSSVVAEFTLPRRWLWSLGSSLTLTATRGYLQMLRNVASVRALRTGGLRTNRGNATSTTCT
jgi:hypothetical protein